MSTTQIDLLKFCSSEDTKYSPSAPFVVAGHLYASNGKICIRIPTVCPEGTNAEALKFVLGLLWDKCRSADKPYPGDAAMIEREIECHKCQGVGMTGQRECVACEGKGEHHCDKCRNPHECDYCNGTGRRGGQKCLSCKGNGLCIGAHHRELSGAIIDAKYDALIVSLPNPKYVQPTDNKSPIAFSFDGGEGFVIPMLLD